MVRGIANSKIGFGDLILLLRYFFKLKVSTHPNRKTLTQISSDIEEINHLVLKIWAIFEFETKQGHIDKSKTLERLDPLRNNLFNDFHLLSKNEGLLLLHDYTQQQEKLRVYGELLGKFNSYTLFRNGSINVEATANFKVEMLEARKNLYLSLNSVLT